MKIILINNASFNSEKINEQNEFFKRSAKKLGIELEIKKNIDINYTFTGSGVQIEKLDCDAILFYDKDAILSEILEKQGYKVFNSTECIKNCDSKALTYKILAENGLPIPKTLIFPLLFFPSAENNLKFVRRVESELTYPLVAKKWFGSEGKQVFLIKDRNELLSLIENEKQELLFQEYFSECYGSDIRFNLVDGKVVECFKRVAKDDFRANVASGGKAENYEPTSEEIELAIKASDALGCKFSGVDILQTNRGAVICEVNSNPQFKNVIFDITGVNKADAMLAYIKNAVNK